MIPNLAVLLLSTTGSTAFFLAGISAGRLLPRSAAGTDSDALDPQQTGRADLEQQLEGMRQELTALRGVEQQLRGALEAETRRADAATERAQSLGARLEAQPPQTAATPGPSTRERELEEEVKRLRGLLDSRPNRASEDASAIAVADDLKLQLEKASQELDKTRKELANERATKARRDGELRKLKDQVQSLEREVEKHKQEEETHVGGPVATEAIRELARLQKELKQTRDALHKEREAHAQTQKRPVPASSSAAATKEVEKLKQRLDAVTSEKEDLEVRQEASAGYVRRAQEQAKQLQDEVAHLQRELEEARAGGDTSDQLKQALARGRDGAAQLVKLKQELAQARHDAKSAVESKQRAQELERELAALQQQLANREQQFETTAAKLAAAESSTAGDPKPSPGLKAPVIEDAATRELKARLGQAETRAALVPTLESANRKLKDLLDEIEPRANSVPELRDRIAKLEARLFALGEKSSPSVAPPPIDADAYPTPAATQNTLRSLLNPETTRAVVLADSHGLPIGAEGDTDTHEGLAAVTGLMGHLASQAQQLLPLGVVSSVVFRDQNDLVVACRLFDCQGDGMALATLGSTEPASGILDRVVAGVVSTLGIPPTARPLDPG